MAFWKNYDPTDILAGGLSIPQNSLGGDVCRLIANEIISLSGGTWKEVTGAAPTPAALWPFASTLGAVGSSGAGDFIDFRTDPLFQVTLYHDFDTVASGKKRLIRLLPGEHWVSMAVLDPEPIGIDVDSDTKKWAINNFDISNTTSYAQMPLRQKLEQMNSRTQWSSGSVLQYSPNDGTVISSHGSNENTTSNVSHTVYITGSDNTLMIRSQKADGARTGEAFVSTFEEPSDLHWDRSNRASIMVMNPSNNYDDAAFPTDSNIWPSVCRSAQVPGHSGADFQILAYADLAVGGFGVMVRYLTPSGKLMVSEIVTADTNVTLAQCVFYGTIKDVLVVPNHSAVGLWDTITINGNQYVCTSIVGNAIFSRIS